MVKMNKAQASLEYFIIFAVIAGLTLLSVSTFLNRTRTSSQNLYSKAVGRILNSQALTPSPTPTPTPTPTPSPTPPPDAIPLIPNQVDMTHHFFPAGSETTFVARVEGDNITQLHLNLNPVANIGLPGHGNETNLTFTLTLPDGTQYSGSAMGTDIGGTVSLRSKNSQYPNTNYDYLPSGDYILTVNAIGNSTVIMNFSYI